MTNSSWTRAHIGALWGAAYGAVVYPPCPTQALAAAGRRCPHAQRERRVVSLAQFRPEKDHALQLQAFALFLAGGRGGGGGGGGRRGRRGPPPPSRADAVLELIGGVRDAGDEERFAALQVTARELGLEVGKNVVFTPNPPFAYVCARLATSLCGLHTMAREHFGISCVEMQAAGCVVIAHDSGGPQCDIVVPAWRPGGGEGEGGSSASASAGARGGYFTGCLARTAEEYAAALGAVFEGGEFDVARMAEAGRESSGRFSEESFSEGFCEAVGGLVEEAAGVQVGALAGAGAGAGEGAPARREGKGRRGSTAGAASGRR